MQRALRECSRPPGGGWAAACLLADPLHVYAERDLSVTVATTRWGAAERNGHHCNAGGLAKGGTRTLHVDSAQVATGRVEHTEPILFSADETCDGGARVRVTGVAGLRATRQRVHRRGELGRALDIGDAADSDTHQLTHEQRFHVAMGVH